MSDELIIEDRLLKTHTERLLKNNAASLVERIYDEQIMQSICRVAHYYCISKNSDETKDLEGLLQKSAVDLGNFPASYSFSLYNTLQKTLPKTILPNWVYLFSPLAKERRPAKVLSMFKQAIGYNHPPDIVIPSPPQQRLLGPS
jgi:hypothetical protein